MTSDRVERLIISYEATTPSVFSLRDATRGLCEIIWLIDLSEPDMANSARLLSRVGRVVDMSDLDREQTVEALRHAKPTGMVSLNDRRMMDLAEIADRLGLDFHTPDVARRLSDKLIQRRALREAGIRVPPFWEVRPGRSAEEAAALARTVRLPAVLKPRSGDGSRDVHLVRSVEQLVDLLSTDASRGSGIEGWILEGYLESSSRPVSRFADVVSVESFMHDGTIEHLAVTGRFPFAEPFRETGSVLPSDLAPSDARAARELAAAAVRALGIRTGCQHTELKFTPEGPVVVEINGRVGGGVPELMTLAGGEISLYRVAVELALGLAPTVDLPLAFPRVAYRRIATPPVTARTVAAMVGHEQLQDVPGVDEITINRLPGDTVDWRLGLGEFIYSAFGSADDYGQVEERCSQIDRTVQVTYDTGGCVATGHQDPVPGRTTGGAGQ